MRLKTTIEWKKSVNSVYHRQGGLTFVLNDGTNVETAGDFGDLDDMEDKQCELEYGLVNLEEAWGDIVEAVERYQDAYRALERIGVDLTHVEYDIVVPEKPEMGE